MCMMECFDCCKCGRRHYNGKRILTMQREGDSDSDRGRERERARVISNLKHMVVTKETLTHIIIDVRAGKCLFPIEKCSSNENK